MFEKLTYSSVEESCVPHDFPTHAFVASRHYS